MSATNVTGTATYVHTFNEAGEFTFEIRGETQAVTVEQPATFEVSDRALNMTSASEVKSVAVTATVTNTGDQAGTYEVPLTVADERADATELRLGPDERRLSRLPNRSPPWERTLSTSTASGSGRSVCPSRRRSKPPLST